ncbi:membrane protein [Burkholderia pseudomallei]|nr:membrane protein [Burkholderia pseudomallei]CAJ2828147.1 membrane protein [Burkholderia pseudomallei]CAJ3931484.1 membrane protein [Burkholderia pseudomallei]CAJ3984480.1 membrane protein [Burkholderia pseudomallei]CAJ4084438.1 membrane protein [Burkholderia pseudomallei]
MARTKPTRANPAPGSGVIFALRAIGLVLLARWLFSMSLMGYRASLSAMASSPWACINVVLIFLLLVLPGAQARAERPLHPLPQWLRQALRFFALLGFLFAAWSVGVFAWAAGWRRALHALTVSNGWLLAAPALYAAVVWVCRPRALWRTNVAARRYAIGRYAVSLDMLTRTVVVWMESRKVGQYDARELSVRWPKGAEPRAASVEADAAGGAMAGAATSDVAAADAAARPECAAPPAQPDADAPAAAPAVARASAKRPAVARPAPRAGGWFARPKIELLWDSPAAVGHNRQIVMRAPLATEGDRVAARALDASLKQIA